MRLTLIAIALPLAACNGATSDTDTASPGMPTPDTGEASSGSAPPVTRPASKISGDARPFTVEALGQYDEPWALEFMPGTNLLFITGKKGEMWIRDVETGGRGEVSGLPQVDYGGQGGFGDIAFGPDWESPMGQGGDLYMSWVEAGSGDTRGAVVGKGTLLCSSETQCRLEAVEVLWRQDKTEGRGHYSHRIHFSPDGQYMFVTSGDRQEQEPAQDTSNNLGAVLRLNLDGSAAEGNPMYDQGGSTAEIWSWGHRNMLGVDFAPDGQLWVSEMGPKHGDELNPIEGGRNYGWPERSYGDNYNGVPIPDHEPRGGYAQPAAYWVPATSPAGLLIYSGDLFSDWRGDALVPGLSGQELNLVSLDGGRATGVEVYDMGARIRDIAQGPDGAVYLVEDDRNDSEGRLLRLRPRG